MSTFRMKWITPVFALVALTAGSAAQANRICYATDRDGDQYAPVNAYQVSVAEANDLYCISSYIEEQGDCDDTNPNIHPRAHEVGGNGKDDNCDGSIDEPTPYFTRPGWNNTQTSFDMLVALNNQTFADWPVPPAVEVELTDLRSSANPQYRAATFISKANGLATVRVTGLPPTRVYRARVRFTICFFSCETTPWSSVYYTTTAGDTQKSHVRTAMVLSALYEWKESQYQAVGYNGKQYMDGKKYGASGGELWCSEFYSWVGNAYLKWDGSRPTNVVGLMNSFKAYGGKRPPSDIPVWADRGDYLGMDTNDDGKKNHSGMVLAWDPSTRTLWTVEGNSHNQVKVNQRSLSQVLGFGHITYSMLK